MIFSILLDVLAPILLMIAAGALLRYQFKIDLGTLSKLNLYLLVPAFVFDKVSNSTLSWAQMGGVVTISIVQVVTLGLLVFGVGRLLGASRKTLAAVALAIMFYNSGNYGLPLAQLAFPGREAAARGLALASDTTVKDGGAVQAFVLMTQNILTYTLGLGIAAMAHPDGIAKSMLRVFRLPMLPVLASALIARYWLHGAPDRALPVFISKTASVPRRWISPDRAGDARRATGKQSALAALEAGLARDAPAPRVRSDPDGAAALGISPPRLASARLVGQERLAAELMILTAGVPTAVGTLLLTLELDGDADLAADCVFWTTVFSCGTIAIWLLILRLWFGS
jgi:predicted permease